MVNTCFLENSRPSQSSVRSEHDKSARAQQNLNFGNHHPYRYKALAGGTDVAGVCPKLQSFYNMLGNCHGSGFFFKHFAQAYLSVAMLRLLCVFVLEGIE